MELHLSYLMTARCWDFVHKVSSPHNPQSNGKAEATVKSMKKLLHTCWIGRSLDHEKFCRALLQYRNTPSRKDGLSTAQKLLFGHPVQDILPAHHHAFLLEWQRPIATAARPPYIICYLLQPTCPSPVRHHYRITYCHPKSTN